jgi:hypothetical protein
MGLENNQIQEWKFIIPVHYIESVNKHLVPCYRRGKISGKPFLYLRKSDEAKRADEDYTKSLSFYISKDLFKDVVFHNMDILYGFYFKELFYKRDTSNSIKIFEDSLARYLGYNDSQVINTHSYKRNLSNNYDGYEFIYIHIRNNAKPDEGVVVDRRTLPPPGLISKS